MVSLRRLGSLPKDKSADAMFEYLHENLGFEDSVKLALQELVHLTREDSSGVDTAKKKSVIKAMKDYMSNSDIQVAACNILNSLVITGTIWLINLLLLLHAA